MARLTGLIAMIGIILCIGCSEQITKKKAKSSALPEWVSQPQTGEKITSVGCSPHVMGLSDTEARALAMTNMMKLIAAKTRSMDRSYIEYFKSRSEIKVEDRFYTLYRKVYKGRIYGARRTKIGIFNVDGRKTICVQMTLNEGSSQKIFNGILEKSGEPFNQDIKDKLYLAWKKGDSEK